MWISPLKYQIMNLEKKIDSIMGGRMPEHENSSTQSSQDPSTSFGDPSASAVADEKLDGNCLKS